MSTARTATGRPARTSRAGATACGRAARCSIHDSFSSVGVTLAILRELAFDRGWRYEGRSGSLAEYRRVAPPLGAGAATRNSLRQLAQLAWFVRNLVIKVLLVARLRPLARALGSDHWPY